MNRARILSTVLSAAGLISAALLVSSTAHAHDWVAVSSFLQHPTVVYQPVAAVPASTITYTTVAPAYYAVAPTVQVQTVMPAVVTPIQTYTVSYPAYVPAAYYVGTGYTGVVWP